MIIGMDTQLANLMRALADETRLEILQFLCGEWRTVNDIVEHVEGKVNQPTVSHHLKKLEEAGLVLMQQDGKYRYYRIDPERIAYCCTLLAARFMPGVRLQFAPLGDLYD
jgi:ArsR family transcriptional regulator, arsenate/arsenite/antimonite-responsive transcriptional repressor